MKTLGGIAFSATIVFAAHVSFVRAQSPATRQVPPDTVVANLYRQDKQVFQQAQSRVLLDRYFEKGLADSIWKKLLRWENSGDSDIEDFDYVLYNFGSAGNDVSSISKPVIGKPTYEGQNAQVNVSYSVVCAPPNCPRRSVQKETIIFQLTSGTPGWKITDIKYDGGKKSLRDIYSQDR